ncbi:MAG: 7-carboxy-7-deazaguanine synthase QueE, partial [Deltaproteobacteria bacterium]|nr:7-carboxy-7-deazaguanine synthase QueE [Deltaproteobacteria bacterium]
GGEPLLQPAVLPLMSKLCDRGHAVLLETGGSLDIRTVDPRVVKIVDLKTPGSGEAGANLYANVEALLPHDEVKLVLADRRDYEWAVEQIERYDLPRRCTVLLSPVHGALDPKDLAAWVLADKLPVRMQIQMHKAIWGAEARGV